jgi:hypothetical protein
MFKGHDPICCAGLAAIHLFVKSSVAVSGNSSVASGLEFTAAVSADSFCSITCPDVLNHAGTEASDNNIRRDRRLYLIQFFNFHRKEFRPFSPFDFIGRAFTFFVLVAVPLF